MITVIQRVKKASVQVDEKIVSSISAGLLVLVGIELDDTDGDLDYCAKKIAEIRIFTDFEGKMNLSVAEINGEILAVSQFTLAGSVRKGRRPSFDGAMEPIKALAYFELFTAKLSTYYPWIKTGSFGDHMEVSLINDGPVTFILDSKKRI